MTIDASNNDVICIGILHVENNRACTIIIGVSSVERDLRTQKGTDQ